MSTFSREEISREYNASAKEHDEYRRVKWGSRESMFNRFALAMSELPFSESTRWLDVGCGTGAFQELVLRDFPNIPASAIDLSERLLEQAQSRVNAVQFLHLDFLEVSDDRFDIITCIGVLQKTTVSLDRFCQHARLLLKKNGLVFVDTKHSGWKKFLEEGFEPEPNISWFSSAEVTQAVDSSGLTLTRLLGFIPHENKLVDPDNSHNIFFIAQKND